MTPSDDPSSAPPPRRYARTRSADPPADGRPVSGAAEPFSAATLDAPSARHPDRVRVSVTRPGARRRVRYVPDGRTRADSPPPAGWETDRHRSALAALFPLAALEERRAPRGAAERRWTVAPLTAEPSAPAVLEEGSEAMRARARRIARRQDEERRAAER